MFYKYFTKILLYLYSISNKYMKRKCINNLRNYSGGVSPLNTAINC